MGSKNAAISDCIRYDLFWVNCDVIAKIFGFETFEEKLMNLEKRLANGEAPEDLYIIAGMFG